MRMPEGNPNIFDFILFNTAYDWHNLPTIFKLNMHQQNICCIINGMGGRGADSAHLMARQDF